MQDNKDNVVSIFSQSQADVVKDIDEKLDKSYFEEAMKKNAENAKRMRDSRNKANRSVLRSYRIKK